MRTNFAARIIFVSSAACTGALALADAHPDLSGTWSLPFRVHSSGVPLWAAQTPWLAPSQGDIKAYKMLTLDEMGKMVDVSVKTHNGNPTFGFPPPLTPPLTEAGKTAMANIDKAKESNRELNCYPTNVFSRVGGGVNAVQVAQSKDTLIIASDGGGPARIIYLDARTHANAVQQWNGHSVGHWVGSTLKVETVKIRGEVMNPLANMLLWPVSENARLLEEFSLINGGKTLQVMATFDDPTYYSEPLKKLMYLERHADNLEVTDYTCEEGKDDMIETALKNGGKT